MTVASLLIELQTEELPPKALLALARAFADGIEAGLRARHLLREDSRATAFATPRRLAVHITHVKSRADDRPVRQKLMPLAVAQDKAKNWTAAFLKKLEALGHGHLARLSPGERAGDASLVVEYDGKGEAVFLHRVAAGQTLLAAAQEALEETLARLPIPKTMSYQLEDGVTTVQFVRPAHRLVALHGHEPLPLRALGLIGGTKTFGHRFHSRGEIAVHSADTYEQQLEREGHVLVSFERRRARIVELLTESARRFGATPLMPPALLDEVTALVEWPVVYDAAFEAEFLAVPPECLILTMQQNQRYFALQDADGRLLNRFLLVSNLQAADGGAAIRAGNARVVRARLADAKFFYEQDRKQTLASRVPGLAQVVYHRALGSQLERVERLVGIAVQIARLIDIDVTPVERAARLAKADLRTEMVGEFPELQGIMGRYYARHDGEPADVAEAIEEHYRPRFADDALPQTAVGTCVALADKLEALVGLFGVGERPTGEKDPFALRRQAIGILRILIEKALPLPLSQLLAIAEASLRSAPAFRPVAAEVASFIYDRLRGLLREQGYRAQEVEAVVSLAPQRIDRVPAQLAAVRAFLQMPEAESLAAANKRIANILRKSATAGQAAAEFNPALLFEPAEKALAEAFAHIAPRADAYFEAADFTAALRALAPLKEPVDRFFDEVLVHVDDERLRANRLALLARLHATMNRVADLSQLAVA